MPSEAEFGDIVRKLSLPRTFCEILLAVRCQQVFVELSPAEID